MSGSGFHATRVTAVVRLSQAKAANQLSRCCTQCVVCVCVGGVCGVVLSRCCTQRVVCVGGVCVGWCSPDAVHSVWCVGGVCVGWCSPDAVHSVWCVCVWVVCVGWCSPDAVHSVWCVCVCVVCVGWCSPDAIRPLNVQLVSSPNLGRNLSFCCLVPNSFMGCITSDDCTLMADR